ncbi:MAG: hypothetical protein IJY72_07810 [Akkermansia sp.]|nr:hypothetical protein [Akkermansia sp.]
METTETVAVMTDADFGAFDSEWNGDGQTMNDDDDGFDMDETDGEEVEADQQNTDEADVLEAADTADTAETKEQTEEQKAETADQRFTLKHLDEVREVSREEVIALAQKGMDYDRKTKNLTEQIEEYEAFLKELAEPAGLDIEQLMDSTRARLFKAKEAKEGREISDTDALLKVQRDRASRQKQKKVEAETTAKQQKEAAEKERNAMLTRFVEIYPEVKATDIPQSVWAEVNKSGNLVEAYSRYENKQLRDKVAVLEQNAKNAARSTGSRKSAGASKPKDPFDDIWDSF